MTNICFFVNKNLCTPNKFNSDKTTNSYSWKFYSNDKHSFTNNYIYISMYSSKQDEVSISVKFGEKFKSYKKLILNKYVSNKEIEIHHLPDEILNEKITEIKEQRSISR